MSPEQNKAVIRRFIDTWNRGDLDGLREFWAPDIVHHARFETHGLDGIQAINALFMSAFPDLRFEIEDIFAEGDRVATRLTARATHEGPFLGVEPSGREVTCSLMEIVRMRDGKIVEHWGLTDELHMMEQIGIVPRELLAAMS